MTTFPSNSQLLNPLFGNETMQRIFSDAQFIDQMVRFESALAEAQGGLGVIPAQAASAITTALGSFTPDISQLQAGIDRAGVPVPELVRQLRQHVGGEAATYMHWGATSQDVMDTAVILQIRQGITELENVLRQTITQLATLADQYRHTLMVGRTHSQHALPITFGYKVAGWIAPLLRHQQRLREMKPRLFVLQFGGAVGTLAALGEMGTAVQEALALSLDLHAPPISWHTQRDNLVECAGWLSLLSGSLGKMAQDIILLAQSEVGELRETADPARGGSSTMPQKSNPIISEGVIAIARANANLLATMHQAQIQEHERGTHGWQMEWLTLPTMFVYTAAALQKIHFLSQNLVVNQDRMRQNVAASNGLLLAEPISLALSQQLGREEAKTVVAEACQQAFAQNRHLVEVIREKTSITLNWAEIQSEANYLGAAQAFIDRILETAVNDFV